MRKVNYFLPVLVILFFSSCVAVKKSYLPQVSNMVKAVTFEELNLTGKDYEILDRVEATARVNVTITSSTYIVDDPDGLFHLEYIKDATGKLVLNDFDGIVRVGYLTREYSSDSQSYPEDIARKMAIYRLINLVRQQGGDGVIEPVISTDFEGMTQEGWNNSITKLTYVATVSGKVVRLKSSK